MARVKGVVKLIAPHVQFKHRLGTSTRCISCSTVNNGNLLKRNCDQTCFDKRDFHLPSFHNPFSASSKSAQNKKLEYSERRVLGYSMAQMYDIVADVESYTDFVPWCKAATISKRQGHHFKCNLTVGFPPVVESYTSIVTVSRPYLVRSEATNGMLFNHLVTTWRFSPGVEGKPDTCTLDFAVSFEFRSKLHQHLATVFFDEVVKTMVKSFLKRAGTKYGPQSMTNLPRKVVTYSES